MSKLNNNKIKSVTLPGKPMSKAKFISFIKKSEQSNLLEFDEAIKLLEQRLEVYRRVK